MRKPDLENKLLSDKLKKVRDSNLYAGIVLADLFGLGCYLMESNPPANPDETCVLDESPSGHIRTAGLKACRTVLNALNINGETQAEILDDPHSYFKWLLPHNEICVLLDDVEASQNVRGRDKYHE